MKKLRLSAEDLHVESFTPSEVRPERGTVEGNITGTICSVDVITCNGLDTCQYGETCGGWATCNFTECTPTCPRCYPGGGGTTVTIELSCPDWPTCGCTSEDAP